MTGMRDLKDVLHDQLREQRAALLGELDGLSERDARLPRTPTGTNLLGLLKHCATIEKGYFGRTFGREEPYPDPWDAPGATPEDNLDMFATEEETLAGILDYARACVEFADETIDSHPIDAEGRVPWWSADKDEVTLGQIMAHVALDGARHAGHADILRERLDEGVGLRTPGDNVVEWTPNAGPPTEPASPTSPTPARAEGPRRADPARRADQHDKLTSSTS